MSIPVRCPHTKRKPSRQTSPPALLFASMLFFFLAGGLSGLFRHPPAYAAPVNWPNISLAREVGGLSHPVHITHAGDGSRRLFVVEQDGLIRIVKSGILLSEPFLDITSKVLYGGERGLLSVAFPPNFASTGHFYVDYTRQPDGATVIARYFVSTSADRADRASEEILLLIDQPFANHNGGQLAFGPDGLLYIGMGDGGSAGDPFNNAQNTDRLLGKLLRIDVESGAAPYAVPADNPFLNSPGARPEIWALGLRNPWRFSFDRLTGDLYIADVGQNSHEEVDFQPSSGPGGENYGWNIMEASHCYPGPTCDSAGLVLPVAEYDHSLGDCAVTGGIVYRGRKYPRMKGIYLYGDYCSGRIRGLKSEGTSFQTGLLTDTPFNITTFGEDETGEIYLADSSTGSIYRIVDMVSIPVPSGRLQFSFPASASPVVSAIPEEAVPVGIGPAASGGEILNVQIALGQFSEAVDIYGAYAFLDNPAHIFILMPDLTFQDFPYDLVLQGLSSGVLPDGITPWMKHVTGPVDSDLFTLPVRTLWPGAYTSYLLVTPAGRLDAYYLGSSSFIIP